jgi:hypothetical protein
VRNVHHQAPCSLPCVTSFIYAPGSLSGASMKEGFGEEERPLVDVDDALSIGQRARRTRCRRGLSLKVAGVRMNGCRPR